MKWGGEAYDTIVKVSNYVDEAEKQRAADLNTNFEAGRLGFGVGMIATYKMYIAKYPDHLSADSVDALVTNVRKTITIALETLQLSKKFNNSDYVETTIGQEGADTMNMAIELNSSKGKNAAKYLLFEYWLARATIEWKYRSGTGFNSFHILEARINDNLTLGSSRLSRY